MSHALLETTAIDWKTTPCKIGCGSSFHYLRLLLWWELLMFSTELVWDNFDGNCSSNSWVLFKNCWDACGFCVTQFVSISYFACSPADYQFMLNWLSVFYERLIGVVAHKANLNFRVVTTTYLSALVEVGFNQIDYRLFQQIRVDLHQIKDWKRSSSVGKKSPYQWNEGQLQLSSFFILISLNR